MGSVLSYAMPGCLGGSRLEMAWEKRLGFIRVGPALSPTQSTLELQGRVTSLSRKLRRQVGKELVHTYLYAPGWIRWEMPTRDHVRGASGAPAQMLIPKRPFPKKTSIPKAFRIGGLEPGTRNGNLGMHCPHLVPPPSFFEPGQGLLARFPFCGCSHQSPVGSESQVRT